VSSLSSAPSSKGDFVPTEELTDTELEKVDAVPSAEVDA
jgi:hypothetical protein